MINQADNRTGISAQDMSCTMTPPDTAAGRALAAGLNKSCFCITLDRVRLADSLREASGATDLVDAQMASRPHLFSNLPVFLPRADLDAMLDIVAAIEEASRLPGYREAALATASAISRKDPGPRGVFMGYDFHLAGDTPRLIEVNTNAGGAFLNALSAKAQLACCEEVAAAMAFSPAGDFEEAVVAMFEAEWRLQGRTRRLESIAIVDDAPAEQYLYPEFVLAQRMLERAGFTARVLDPSELAIEGGELRHRGDRIDLVYNRLVDFDLSKPEHLVLRTAYEDDLAVLTPSPHVHALLADKRNLTRLTDPACLAAWDAPGTVRSQLATIAKAVMVTGENAEALWSRRKSLFFKPVA